MSYIHDTLFGIGIDIWHKVSHRKGLVLSICIKPNGIIYEVVWENMTTAYHYEIELVDEIPAGIPPPKE